MRPHVPLSYQFHLQLKRQREWESQVHLVSRLVEPPTDESWISWWESLHVQAGKLIGHANDWGWKMGRWFYGIAFGSERPSTTFSCRPKNQRNVYICQLVATYDCHTPFGACQLLCSFQLHFWNSKWQSSWFTISHWVILTISIHFNGESHL